MSLMSFMLHKRLYQSSKKCTGHSSALRVGKPKVLNKSPKRSSMQVKKKKKYRNEQITAFIIPLKVWTFWEYGFKRWKDEKGKPAKILQNNNNNNG